MCIRDREVGRSLHVALRVLLARGDGGVVAPLAGDLGVLGGSEQGGVEGVGRDVFDPEEVPRAAVGAGVLVVLGERGSGGIEHRVVGGADGALAVAGGEDFACHRQPVAGLVDELLRAWAHRYSSPSRSPPARTSLSRSTSWKKKSRIARRSRRNSAS